MTTDNADPMDIDSPEYRAERLWSAAYTAWLENNPALLASLIRGTEPIPAQWRDFLAELAEGKATRGKGGRPPERPAWVERSIVADVFSLRDAGKSDDDSRAIVAQQRSLTDDAVRGVVEKLRAQGITLERWRAWGRPRWQNR